MATISIYIYVALYLFTIHFYYTLHLLNTDFKIKNSEKRVAKICDIYLYKYVTTICVYIF